MTKNLSNGSSNTEVVTHSKAPTIAGDVKMFLGVLIDDAVWTTSVYTGFVGL